MKRTVLGVIAALFMMPMMLFSQTYDALWKQVNKAENDDLPQTQLKVLQQIVKKAEKELAYGQLLKASLMHARVQATVSPDSLQPAVERLQLLAEATQDVALQSVYYAVLGKIYASNTQLSDDWQSSRDEYFRKAMEHPAELAAVKTDGYMPFVVKGKDSQLYGDDLLSLIGHETRQFRPMHDYYMTTENRRAQLMSGLYLLSQEEPEETMRLKDCDYIRRLDSLANAYADLPECGEVAISRYEFMADQTDAKADEKIAYIDEALARWGTWHRMNVLRNARQTLTARQFDAVLEHKVWIPNRPQELRLQGLRGIAQLTINIYKVKVDGDTSLNPDDKDDYKKLKPLLTHLPELTLTSSYSGKKEYELYDDTLQMAALPVGVYMMEVESQPRSTVARTLFFVSDVRVLMQALPHEHDNQLRYVVVNATTGKPISGAKLRLMRRWGYNYNKDKVFETLTTDSKGEAIYICKNQERPNYVYATTKDDRACPEMNANGHFSYYANERTTEQVAIYTDRAIYRPGQTVHVAAICYETRNGFEHEAQGGKWATVQLRDANYKVVAEKQLLTDELGTLSTDFTLPASGLTGRYTVQVNDNGYSFRVEEYKRPTFQVEFPKVEQHYKDGDTLTVKATARTYAGTPVQGARVKYTVERRMAFWWISYYRYWQGGYFGNGEQNEEIFSGEATTADDGTFEVQMPMVLPQSIHPQFFNFVVEADVTDQAGETRQGQLSLPLGNRDGVIVADLPDKVLAEDMPKLKLHMLNAAGNDVSATLRYQIDGGKWMLVQSNTSVDLPKLKSGKHKLNVEYEDKKSERDFVVFSLDDKRPVMDTDDWFYVSAQQFPNNGKPVTLQVGASGDVHIVYTLVAGSDIIEQGAVDKSNELINRKLTYKPEYGNGLTLSYAWVRDGRTHTYSQQIQRPLPDKKLKMKWETFRDRLKPGQQEEWTLKIEAPNINSHLQLMATLYDKSLDQILSLDEKREWSLEPRNWLPMASLNWTRGYWGTAGCSAYQHVEPLNEDNLLFSTFDSDCIPYSWLIRRHRTLTRNGAFYGKAMATLDAAPMALQEVAVASQKAIGAFDVAGNDEEALRESGAGLDISDQKKSEPEVQMRENLQETAFFYPQLMADSTGRVSISFKLPESLTTWRFMGIAHTKDMMHGFIDGEAVAQKDVMIQPNVPRFIRVGDKATVSARVFNVTDKEQSGTAQLQLIDPENDQVVYSQQTACLIPANGTYTVSFPVDATSLGNYSLLVCKMSVSGETFSDGEQHYLPVLPNRERVTVTVPFTQNEPGTKTIDLKSLFPDAVANSKLTVEYTNNPAWLMVQALPTIGKPCDKNAISQAASLYANGIGKFIIDQNPQTKHVFEMWKQENAQLSPLNSQLEKNEELRDLVLNETPWVLDADQEAEQKQRLADFFDENLIEQRLQSATEQLKKLQCADGSWSWWEGMPSSFYITVEVSEMLVRLNQMTGNSSSLSALQSPLDKAFKFMNKEILELVAEMKKEEKKGIKQTFPTFKALQYLYICTLDGRQQPANVLQAQAYLKKLLKKDVKNQTIYEKAMSAIVLNAPLYIKSLKEYTVYKEEMGRYYDTPRASYSWRDYRIPTQVAAIEAIQRLSPNDTQTIDEMRRWLLQEKRTQAWDTPINSVDAIYAFLNGNSQELKPQAKTVLSIDGKTVDTSEATAGIGYVKTAQTYNGERTFTAEKTSTGTSWGAVYAQFMQNTGDISDQKSGISVKREILSDEPLKVGDRVKVRLTIEADRDYDFVQVVDKRAACMEPVSQLSGYHWGYYCAPKDNATNYFFHLLPKGKRIIETEYYIDRAGCYETGTCTVQCAYAPEFRGTTRSQTINVKSEE
ncbi:MAG: alpha-2-macroglobulin [Prevotella sp.]|nr:alpha-2-macroglobulin [Prevotella sp.]